MIAEFGSASHLDKLVSQFRRVKCLYQREEERRQGAVVSDLRRLDHYWDEDGMLVIRARLPPEQGALVLKSLQTAVEALNKDRPLTEQTLDEDTSEPGFYDITVERHMIKARKNRRADALVNMAETHLQHSTGTSSCADRYQVAVIVDHHLLAEGQRQANLDKSNSGGPVPCDASVSGQVIDPHCELANGPALPLDAVKRLCCDCSLIAMHEQDGEALSVGRKTRVIPPAMKRALERRDGGCRFPGCDATRFVEGHHIEHWADGGETCLDNLVSLCRHHHRLMHEGGFSIDKAGRHFVFANPAGEVIPQAGRWAMAKKPLEWHSRYKNIVHDSGDDIERQIDENTLWCWNGDRIDWSLAVEHLQMTDSYFWFSYPAQEKQRQEEQAKNQTEQTQPSALH